MADFTIRATEKDLESLCKTMKGIAKYAWQLFDEADPTHSSYQTGALQDEALSFIKKYSGDNTLPGTPSLFNAVYDAYGVSSMDGKGSCDLDKGTTELKVEYVEDETEVPEKK